MKRFLSMLLALCMVLSLVPARALAAEVAGGSCGNNLSWTLDGSGTLTISGEGWMTDCPWAENYRLDITSVVVEEGASYIYPGSFSGCTNLTKVSLPDSLLQIGEDAFRDCTGLTQLHLPEGLHYTEQNAFAGSGIREITLPAAFVSLDGGEFSGCSQLENIWVAEGNDHFVSIDGVLFSSDMTLLEQYPLARSGSYTVPEGVESIGYMAFDGCTGLTGVELASTVNTIGSYAFRGCTALKSITFPENLYNIYDAAFSGCTGLTDITFTGDAPYFDEDVFTDVTATAHYNGLNSTWTEDVLWGYGGNITWEAYRESEETVSSGSWGDSLTWKLTNYGTLTISGTGPLGDQDSLPWMDNRQNITKVIIEAGITAIGYGTFAGCDNLTDITIPNSITSIGDRAFDGAGLTSLTIPDSVTQIGEYAFEDCDSLPEIILPDSITTISKGMFSSCDALTSITLPDSITTICDEAFDGCRVLSGIVIPDSVTSIGNDAFIYCTRLEEMIIPDSVSSIGTYAFRGCTSLTDITLPDSITTISEGLFYECTSLPSILIPEGVTTIGDRAFRDCTALAAVAFPESLTSIGNNVFSNCEKLNGVELPAALESIGSSAFYGCITMPGIRIPGNCTHIGRLAFAYCDGLESMYFEGSAPMIDDTAFYYSTFTAYYPEGYFTWNANTMLDYGGTITWQSYTSGEGSWDDYFGTIVKLEDEPFNYYSVIEKDDVNYTFDYDESWFFNSSTKYNQDLAQMSIRMAMAAARTTDVSIVKLFDTLGFDYVNNVKSKKDDLDANDGDTIKYPTPTKDTIGYAIGSKQIRAGSGETITLIAVAVRGGGYDAEWANNFLIGTGTVHEGFSNAADRVTNAIKSYISQNNIDSNIKIWITGYSRAAATSNVAAHNLNEAAREGQIPGLEADGVFAYCFECPRTVKTSQPEFDADDSNIFNIVNPIDFVPMLAMQKWDFDRYGITYYLPSSELKYYDFQAGYDKMREQYKAILQGIGSNASVEVLTAHSLTQHTALESAADSLAAYFGNQDRYINKYQDSITQVLETYHRDTFDVSAVLETLFGTLRDFVGKHPFAVSNITRNALYLGPAHYPELCLAWMDALEGHALNISATTRYLMVNCPVDVSVYDSSGTLVAQIVNDEVQKINGSTIGALVDENGQKTVILPPDEEFHMEFAATDDGIMSWQVQEYDTASGHTTRVLNCYDVEIRQGDTLTGTAGSDSAYAFYDTDGSEIPIDAEISGDEIPEITLIVNAEGSGIATGGGYFMEGEFAKVTAVADDGAEFLGWYIDGVPVSTEAEYRFRMEADCSIIGRFAHADVPGDLNGDGSVDNADVAQLLWHTLFPDSCTVTGNADFNGDGSVDDSDVAYLLWHTLFPENYPL